MQAETTVSNNNDSVPLCDLSSVLSRTTRLELSSGGGGGGGCHKQMAKIDEKWRVVNSECVTLDVTVLELMSGAGKSGVALE